MKLRSLLLFLYLSTWTLQAQIVCAVTAPQSAATNLAFSYAVPSNNWGSPDFTIPGNHVTGELALVDDGTPGINPLSNVPLGAYGCAPLVNSIAGKIAFVYRYDGVTASTLCFLYDKALNAQNAGAVAVVVVNRPDGPEDVGGGGTVGPGVTIPVVMISFSDGEVLRNQLQTGPIELFIGNKTGLFTNDVGLSTQNNLIPKSYAVPSFIALNGSPFTFDLGTQVHNYGTATQSNLFVHAQVKDPSGATLYTQSIGPMSLNPGDSVSILPGGTYAFPAFNLPLTNEGIYDVVYSTEIAAVADSFPGDNSQVHSFFVNDKVFSYARIDSATNLPKASNNYRPTTSNSTYSICSTLKFENADLLGITGLSFSSSTPYGSGISLAGEEILISLYVWGDNFSTINDPTFGFTVLNPLNMSYYYYPSDLQYQAVKADFTGGPIMLQNNQRYLACAQTTNPQLFFGHDGKTNYTTNQLIYAQPISPNESDGTYYGAGFGSDLPSALGIHLCVLTDGSCNLSVPNLSSNQQVCFPNPFDSSINVEISNETAFIKIVDCSDQCIYSQPTYAPNGKVIINTSNWSSGMYFIQSFNAKSELQTTQKVVKH
jgi:hypothetical protein